MRQKFPATNFPASYGSLIKILRRLEPSGAADLPALARGELKTLLSAVKNAQAKTKDRVTRLHLQDLETRIDRILDPRLKP